MQSGNDAANACGPDKPLKIPLSLLDGLFSFSISSENLQDKLVTAWDN